MPTVPLVNPADDANDIRRFHAPPRFVVTTLASTGCANPSRIWTPRVTPTRALHVRPIRRVSAASPVRTNATLERATGCSCGTPHWSWGTIDDPLLKVSVVFLETDRARV